MFNEENTPYWIIDPGHGWLVVPTALVNELGVQPSGFSYYSALRGLSYLEEDEDAGPMLTAMGLDPNLTIRHINNFDDMVRRHGLKRWAGNDTN